MPIKFSSSHLSLLRTTMAVTFKAANHYANTRQIVDHGRMREVDAGAGGGMRARLALRGGIRTLELAGTTDLRA